MGVCGHIQTDISTCGFIFICVKQYKEKKKLLPELQSRDTERGKNEVEEEIRWLNKHKLIFPRIVRNV